MDARKEAFLRQTFQHSQKTANLGELYQLLEIRTTDTFTEIPLTKNVFPLLFYDEPLL
jgi:hypothetical protein